MKPFLATLFLLLLLTACGGAGASPEVNPPDAPAQGAEAAAGDALSPANEAAVATIEASPIEERGLITVPFAAGAREYIYQFTLPRHWRSRYTIVSPAENTLTYAYVPAPDEAIPIFTLIAKARMEWDAVPMPGAVEVLTLEDIVFGFQPGDLAAIEAAGSDAAMMLADLPAIIASLEISRNTDPGG